MTAYSPRASITLPGGTQYNLSRQELSQQLNSVADYVKFLIDANAQFYANGGKAYNVPGAGGKEITIDEKYLADLRNSMISSIGTEIPRMLIASNPNLSQATKEAIMAAAQGILGSLLPANQFSAANLDKNQLSKLPSQIRNLLKFGSQSPGFGFDEKTAQAFREWVRTNSRANALSLVRVPRPPLLGSSWMMLLKSNPLLLRLKISCKPILISSG